LYNLTKFESLSKILVCNKKVFTLENMRKVFFLIALKLNFKAKYHDFEAKQISQENS
jgi:hypothetical protein